MLTERVTVDTPISSMETGVVGYVSVALDDLPERITVGDGRVYSSHRLQANTTNWPLRPEAWYLAFIKVREVEEDGRRVGKVVAASLYQIVYTSPAMPPTTLQPFISEASSNTSHAQLTSEVPLNTSYELNTTETTTRLPDTVENGTLGGNFTQYAAQVLQTLSTENTSDVVTPTMEAVESTTESGNTTVTQAFTKSTLDNTTHHDLNVSTMATAPSTVENTTVFEANETSATQILENSTHSTTPRSGFPWISTGDVVTTAPVTAAAGTVTQTETATLTTQKTTSSTDVESTYGTTVTNSQRNSIEPETATMTKNATTVHTVTQTNPKTASSSFQPTQENTTNSSVLTEVASTTTSDGTSSVSETTTSKRALTTASSTSTTGSYETFTDSSATSTPDMLSVSPSLPQTTAESDNTAVIPVTNHSGATSGVIPATDTSTTTVTKSQESTTTEYPFSTAPSTVTFESSTKEAIASSTTDNETTHNSKSAIPRTTTDWYKQTLETTTLSGMTTYPHGTTKSLQTVGYTNNTYPVTTRNASSINTTVSTSSPRTMATPNDGHPATAEFNSTFPHYNDSATKGNSTTLSNTVKSDFTTVHPGNTTSYNATEVPLSQSTASYDNVTEDLSTVASPSVGTAFAPSGSSSESPDINATQSYQNHSSAHENSTVLRTTDNSSYTDTTSPSDGHLQTEIQNVTERFNGSFQSEASTTTGLPYNRTSTFPTNSGSIANTSDENVTVPDVTNPHLNESSQITTNEETTLGSLSTSTSETCVCPTVETVTECDRVKPKSEGIFGDLSKSEIIALVSSVAALSLILAALMVTCLYIVISRKRHNMRPNGPGRDNSEETMINGTSLRQDDAGIENTGFNEFNVDGQHHFMSKASTRHRDSVYLPPPPFHNASGTTVNDIMSDLEAMMEAAPPSRRQRSGLTAGNDLREGTETQCKESIFTDKEIADIEPDIELPPSSELAEIAHSTDLPPKTSSSSHIKPTKILRRMNSKDSAQNLDCFTLRRQTEHKSDTDATELDQPKVQTCRPLLQNSKVNADENPTLGRENDNHTDKVKVSGEFYNEGDSDGQEEGEDGNNLCSVDIEGDVRGSTSEEACLVHRDSSFNRTDPAEIKDDQISVDSGTESDHDTPSATCDAELCNNDFVRDREYPTEDDHTRLKDIKVKAKAFLGRILHRHSDKVKERTDVHSPDQVASESDPVATIAVLEPEEGGFDSGSDTDLADSDDEDIYIDPMQVSKWKSQCERDDGMSEHSDGCESECDLMTSPEPQRKSVMSKAGDKKVSEKIKPQEIQHGFVSSFIKQLEDTASKSSEGTLLSGRNTNSVEVTEEEPLYLELEAALNPPFVPLGSTEPLYPDDYKVVDLITPEASDEEMELSDGGDPAEDSSNARDRRDTCRKSVTVHLPARDVTKMGNKTAIEPPALPPRPPLPPPRPTTSPSETVRFFFGDVLDKTSVLPGNQKDVHMEETWDSSYFGDNFGNSSFLFGKNVRGDEKPPPPILEESDSKSEERSPVDVDGNNHRESKNDPGLTPVSEEESVITEVSKQKLGQQDSGFGDMRYEHKVEKSASEHSERTKPIRKLTIPNVFLQAI
ncbi:serine-rich adhesin for platelets-like [Ptychodera flava]|uniref:serine-rich adhesin for platelets-like n=1 Tax=Ptychodera flava TaxID=63121 RepID=UPI00396A33E9